MTARQLVDIANSVMMACDEYEGEEARGMANVIWLIAKQISEQFRLQAQLEDHAGAMEYGEG